MHDLETQPAPMAPTDAPARSNRRALLRSVATLGVATAAATLGPSVAAEQAAAAAGSDVVLSDDPDVHLLRRATFGPTRRDLRELRRLGREAWLDRQLDPGSVSESGGLFPALSRFDMRYRSLNHIDDTSYTEGGQWTADRTLAEASVVRAVWSRRQLNEKVVELWSNHLSIAKNDELYGARLARDRQLRKRALGPFRDLLVHDALHPAMLHYLDAATSVATAPNENYGRELLELHTVGIDGGYTEDDVLQAALAFTGWTIDWDRRTTTFRKRNHHVGPLQVMGWRHDNADPSDGREVGRSLLAYLAEHPATARTVATKMARHFVADDPPAALVNQLAKVYLDNDTDVRPVLKALFTSAAFNESVGAKVRRPIDQVTAALRAMERRAGPRVLRGHEDYVLTWICGQMGQEPMGWPAPDGFPDTADAWLSTSRMSTSIRMMNGLAWSDYGEMFDDAGDAMDRLVGKAVGGTAAELVDLLASRIVFQRVDDATRDGLLALVDTEPDKVLDDLEQVRWRAQSMTRVLLMSPYMLQR